MTIPIRVIFVLFLSIITVGCATIPATTKADMANKLITESRKTGNYLKLAHYWDDHAKKVTIDFKSATYLSIWENEGIAEITIGNGPYYGMIKLIALDKNNTLIKCYAWGSLSGKITEWKNLIEGAPQE
jgi:hypothetical protein